MTAVSPPVVYEVGLAFRARREETAPQASYLTA